LDACCLRGDGKHKAEKPLDLMLDLVSYFTDPGEFVIDPFGGSGTTALACALLDRGCVLLEGCPANAGDELRVHTAYWAEFARRRLVGELSPRDLERVSRWLGPRRPNAGRPGDTETGPTGIVRARARARDREILLAQPRVAPFVDRLLKAA